VRGLRDRVLAAAAAAGRDPGELTCAYNLGVRVDGHERPGASPSVVAGPADAVAEQLAGLAGLGFSAFNLQPVGPDPAAQVERLANEVVPAVRTALGR